MTILRWILAIAVLALIGWLLGSSWNRPAPVRDPVADAPWGPGKNRLNCNTMETDQPLPDVDPITRARILELLKQACQEADRGARGRAGQTR